MADDFAERLDRRLESDQEKIEQKELSEQEAKQRRREDAGQEEERRVTARGIVTRFQCGVLEDDLFATRNKQGSVPRGSVPHGSVDPSHDDDNISARVAYRFGNAEVVVTVGYAAGDIKLCASVLLDNKAIYTEPESFSLDEFDESHAREWAECQIIECVSVAKLAPGYRPPPRIPVTTYEQNA